MRQVRNPTSWLIRCIRSRLISRKDASRGELAILKVSEFERSPGAESSAKSSQYVRRAAVLAFAFVNLVSVVPALAADSFNGEVLGGGAPIAGSSVPLWAATADVPKQLAQARRGRPSR